MTVQSWNPFLRFPRASLLLTILLCAPLLMKLADFDISSETRILLEGDQRNLSSYEKVRQILADAEVVVISMECDEVFSLHGIDAVRRVSNAFQQQDGVEEVKGLTHSVKPVRRGFSFEMVPLIPESPTAADLERLKSVSLQHPLIRNVMVAADSKHTIIMVTYHRKLDTPEAQRALRGEVEATLRTFQIEGLRFQILAVPLIEEEIRSTLRSDIQRFLPLAAVFLMAILGWTFRSLTILGLVLINQLLLLAILPGMIEALGFTLNVFSIMLVPLLAGIHLAQMAHVYTAFQRARTLGHGTSSAIGAMWKESFKSCAFSLITTAIGLISLTSSEVRQIREFGIIGTVGVCVIFLLTFGPGLALLQIAFRRPLASSSTLTVEFQKRPESWINWIGAYVQRRGPVILGLAGLAMAISCVGLGMIRTDIRAVEFLNPNSATRQSVEELDRIYGGINVVQIEIDSGKENGVNQLPILKYVERLQRYAESRPDISAVYSYAQLLAMVNQIWEGDRPDAFKLPENPLLISLFVITLKSQEYPFLTALSDKTFRKAYLVLRTRDMPSERYLALLDEITAFAQRNKPDNVVVSAGQGIHSILEADRRIIRSQISSAGITTLVIGAVLTALWRSSVLAFLSIITNAIPVALVLAVAGFAGIPLNSITVMVAAICLGIAVDDSIHFITHWRDVFKRSGSAKQAVVESFVVKGRPIVFTSVILICIFSIFLFSSFPPVVHFGFLSAIAFVIALTTVLFFLPAVLCFFPDRSAPNKT